MKLFSFTFVKKAKLKQYTEEHASLQSQIASAAEFISEIEKGNLEVKYYEEENISKIESADQLAQSLISLRKQLVKVSQEEKQRNWVADTRSKFMDILRSRDNDLKELAEDIIRSLVKYLSANQGGLFLVNDDNENDIHIEQLACYAYERKKHLNQRIEIGEGLIGQTILEKESIYLTEIPQNYLKITSGLGEANPRHLLIVPLKLEDKVFGAIEIASFHAIKDYEIEFTEQLGESIASTIANAKNNFRTKKLLEETQQQAEEMRAQEEEVRQNMEELSATQEDMQRVMKELQGNEAFMKGLIDASSDAIFTIDREYKIINCNKVLKETYSSQGAVIDKGFEILGLFTDEQKSTYKKYYDRVLGGEAFKVSESFKSESGESFFEITYSPLRDEEGKVTGAAVFGKDITEIEVARINNEKLLSESQSIAEKLKEQENERSYMMQELQEKEEYTTALMGACKDTIFVIDTDYRYLDFNETFKASIAQTGVKINIGDDVFKILSESERAHHKELYDKVFKGESFEVTEHIAVADAYYLSSYNPLKDKNGDIYACAVYAKDITELVKSQKQAEALLHESQQQGEEMKAQEEELRQNMEELSATQEEMHRIMKDVQRSEHYLTELLNITQDTIYTIDKGGKILTFNRYFEENMKRYGIQIDKGFDYLSILPSEEEKQSQRTIIDKVFEGEAIEIPLFYEVEGGEIHLISNYSPIRNVEGEIVAVAVYSRDVTELVMAKQKASQADK